MTTPKSTTSFDTVIIGAGILGLWAARYVIGEGRSVCILEKGKVGDGASGGILGALMSHIPDGWNIKKEFQYNALQSLEGELERLQNDTGINAGYRRCGRVMPLAHEGMVSHVESWLRGAKTNWHGLYDMDYLAPGHSWFDSKTWPPVENAPYGASHDNFAARVAPRGVVRALASFVDQNGDVRQGCNVVRIDPERSEVVLGDGSRITAGEIIVANGVEAYNLLEPFMGSGNDNKPLGRGVRGQAVMIEYHHDDTLPILYQDGIYIVPHQNNLMAIGSTSHNVELSDIGAMPVLFDPADMAFYQKAMALAPMLKHAPIVERWSGIRPRNTLVGRGADPWFEKVPGRNNLIALMGGFKITFGIAHVAMDVARGKIEGPRRSKLSWVQ